MRIVEGTVRVGDHILLMATNKQFVVIELGESEPLQKLNVTSSAPAKLVI